MLILNNEQALEYHPIIKYIPRRLRKYLSMICLNETEEVRLRKGRPLMVYFNDGGYFIDEHARLSKNEDNGVIVENTDIEEAIELISGSSLYAFEDCLKQGYITICGGHRVGLCGSAVLEKGVIASQKNISSINYRLSREIMGAAEKLIPYCIKEGRVLNTLIISPPGCGKTTMLRDLIRIISQKGYRVSAADERNEISAVHNGYVGYNLGYSCDVLEGASKSEAMLILLRTMSPQVIATDEIGLKEDIYAVERAIFSGVSVIATVHSQNLEALKKANISLIDKFECFVTLSHRKGPGTVEEVFCDI
ncbi:MAG: stage III sporulation protein AA [Clostridia bacterium]|nr:stage III sporulation protein AA [Clostridia bacterium]